MHFIILLEGGRRGWKEEGGKEDECPNWEK